MLIKNSYNKIIKILFIYTYIMEPNLKKKKHHFFKTNEKIEFKKYKQLKKLLNYDENKKYLDNKDVVKLLNMRWKKQEELFMEAQKVREKTLWGTVSIRGVIEASSKCNVNCKYCAMRVENKMERYSMTSELIFNTAKEVDLAWIQTLFIQTGEDKEIDHNIIVATKKIRKELFWIKNIILNCWNRSKEEYKKFKDAWVDWYILKFEISNPQLFKSIRFNSLEKRIKCIDDIKSVGLKIWTWNIIWLPGQTIEDMAEDILFSFNIKPDYISTAPFIPNWDTPFVNEKEWDVDVALNTISLLRILLPQVFIPSVSALQKLKDWWQVIWLNAGANTITINFTPEDQQNKYKIYNSWGDDKKQKRFVVKKNYALKVVKDAWLLNDIKNKTMITTKRNETYEKNLKELPWCIEEIPNWFSNIVEWLSKWTALDMWCWIWNYSNYLNNNWFKTTALDLSKNAIALAKNKFWKNNWITFIRTDILEYKTQNKFDLLCDISLFHHIKPKDRSSYLQKLSNLLKPSWTIILSCFNSEDKRFSWENVFANSETNTEMYPLKEEEIEALFKGFDFKMSKIKHWKDDRERFLFILKHKATNNK